MAAWTSLLAEEAGDNHRSVANGAQCTKQKVVLELRNSTPVPQTTDTKNLKPQERAMAPREPFHIHTILHSINVEPVMFLYMFSLFLIYPAQQAFVYARSCASLFNATICDNIKNHTDESDEVQTLTSHWIMYMTLSMTLPSVIMVLLFYGPLGDIYGRKIPVFIPCAGNVLLCISFAVISYYPDVPFYTFLIGPLASGLSGGFIGLMMGVYSYTTSVAHKANRTVRIAIMEAMIFFAGTIGVLLSGVLIDSTSFHFVFGLVGGVMVICLLYIVIFLDNIKPVVHEQNSSQDNGNRIIRSIKEMFMCIGKTRPKKYKLYIGINITILCIIMLCTTGEADILLLYVKRPELDWTLTFFGYFRAFESVMRSIGVLVFLPICKWRYKMKDTTLMLFGLISKILYLVLIGVASETWLFFVAGVCSVLQGFPSAAIRSTISGLVEKDEQGRLFSVAASSESFATLFATLIFNNVYPATLDLFAGIPFIMAAGFLAIAWLMVVWQHYDTKEVVDHESFDTLNEEVSSSTDLANSNVSSDFLGERL